MQRGLHCDKSETATLLWVEGLFRTFANRRQLAAYAGLAPTPWLSGRIEELFRKTGYSRPHTVHCGPEGIYVSTLGGRGKQGTERPPGVFIMDCETFEILGRWEIDRGPQTMHYDFWWNLPRGYMVTSEWGLPPQFENGGHNWERTSACTRGDRAR